MPESEAIIENAPSFATSEAAIVALSSATFILTAVTILVGLVALVGISVIYRNSIRAAEKAGDKASQNSLEQYLTGDEFRALIDDRIDAAVADRVRNTISGQEGPGRTPSPEDPASATDEDPKPMTDL